MQFHIMKLIHKIKFTKMNAKILTTVLTLAISSTMVFAQEGNKSYKKQSSATKTEQQKDSLYYTCSMHPEVKKDEPGKCPKCKMTLEKKTMKMMGTKSEKKEIMKMYTCSMHADVISEKPGKCPKCGMELVEKK